MANISSIKLPNGTIYNIKDSISGYTTNTGTVTSVTAGTGLSGGTITTSGTISLATSGATAGSYGDSSAQTPGYGSTFKVPYVTVDTYGRVTGISEHTVKIPASDNTNTWRGIQDNLTSSTNTTESLSAKQGYLLANGYARDNTKLPLTGGQVTGAVTFGSSVSIDALTTGSLIVNGSASFVNGINAAQLTGTVPTACLPSYVDDVLEYAAKANFPSTGETGKIYVDKTTNLTWRWGGSSYVEISPSLAIGKTSSTAAAGNHTHSVSITPSKTDVYSMTSAGSVTAGTKASFTQGTDSFTANTPTTPAKIDTTKFSGGSYSHSGFSGGSYSHSGFSGGSFNRGSFSGGSLTMSINGSDSGQLDITFTAATHAADSFTAATYGTDSFTAATYGTDSFTAASLASGFYTAGTKGTSASFTQGSDSFTQNTPTAVTLPGRSSKIEAWTGYSSATANAQS